MIKKYSIKDWAALKKLCVDEKYFDDYTIFYKDPHFIPFIFVDDKELGNNRILGTIVVSRSLDNLNINYVYVHSHSRSKGIGKLLFKYVEKYAKDHGYVGLRLEVDPTNLRAIKFYKREGYIKTGNAKNFYTDSGKQSFFWKKV